MELLKEIATRRSIRNFENKQVEQEKIELILEAGMLAPSAKNEQPWEFIVIKNKDIINKLADVSSYAKPCLNSNLVIVPVLDENRITVQDKGYAIQDMALCIENMMLEAVNLDLGSVYLGIYPNQDRVEKLADTINLDLSQNKIPFCILCIGYPTKLNGNKYISRKDNSRITYID